MVRFLKYGLRVCTFVVVLAVLLALASLVVMPKSNTSQAGMAHAEAMGVLGEPDNSLDVVFFGDSDATTAISPLAMYEDRGFTSYNCAAAGQYLPHMKHMVKRVLRNQTPSLVVIETNIIYGNFSIAEAVNRELKEALPVFQYHDRWKRLTLTDFTCLPSYTATDPEKGYILRADWSEADGSSYMSPNAEVEPIPSMCRAYMDDIISTCRAKGAQVLLLSVPSAANWSMARHNGIAAYAQQEGLAYLDMNLEHVGIDWAHDTRDGGDHLNARGAMKTSAFLSARLAKNYQLGDHRGKGSHYDWDKAAQGYREHIGSLKHKRYER